MRKRQKIFVGTRGSPLALSQTRLFLKQWQARYPDLETELVVITTSGDRIQDRFLSEVGGKGLFVKEIEEAMLAGEIHMAVHSLKDLPGQLATGLKLGCMPRRLPPWDVLISRSGVDLALLPLGAKVGTSSPRRRAQLGRLRPDLNFAMLRGNIDTRLQKLRQGDYEAIVLAQAGMERLGLSLQGSYPLPTVPAPGQGTLAIEICEDDSSLETALSVLHDEETALVSQIERQVLGALGGNCDLPLGVLAEIRGDQVHLRIFLSSADGVFVLEWQGQEPRESSEVLVDRALEYLDKNGAKKIVQSCVPQRGSSS